MKFKKEDLVDASGNNPKFHRGPLANTLLVEHDGSDRWHQHYRRVFEFEGHLYVTYWRVGSTECQDTGPYEDEDDEIECCEVFARAKTITEYVSAEELAK